MIFKAAVKEGALDSADCLGKRKVIKRSWGFSVGKRSRNYSDAEGHRLKPHELRRLSKQASISAHCEKGHRKGLLRPIERDGKVCEFC